MPFADFFLTDPALFPATPTGTPWGGKTVNLAMAGIPFRFSGLSALQANYIRDRYADFLLAVPDQDLALGQEQNQRQHQDSDLKQDQSPHKDWDQGHDQDRYSDPKQNRGQNHDQGADPRPVHTVLYRADPGHFRPFEQRGWTYTLDRDYAPDRVRVAGLDLMAMLNLSPRLSAALWSATEASPGFPLVFDNVFRLISAYALLVRGVLLLHSAGVSDGHWAWIGFGHSGAGKSTLSGLALDAGQRVLSDDLNVLRRESGRWTAQRVPFAGTLGPTRGDDRSYPLAGLARLHQGAEHRLTPLPRPRALAALVGSAPYLNHDPYRVEDLMALLESLLLSVDCYDLSFRKDAGFWPLLAAAARAVEALRPSSPPAGADP